MPRVMRQVESDVTNDELNDDLATFAEGVLQDGAYLLNEDGSKGELIEEGDCLVPNEQTYGSGILAPDTHVYVIRTVPEAGIIWGAFHRPDGQKAIQFFVPQAFSGKYTGETAVKGARNPLATPARKAAKNATPAPKRRR